jgi:hypothetical protein
MLCRSSVIASGLLILPPFVSFAFCDQLQASWISPKLSNAWALPTFLLTACAFRSSRQPCPSFLQTRNLSFIPVQVRCILRRHEAERARCCKPSCRGFVCVHGRRFIVRLERRQPVDRPPLRVATLRDNCFSGIFSARCCLGLLCKCGAFRIQRGRAASTKAPQGEAAQPHTF